MVNIQNWGEMLVKAEIKEIGNEIHIIFKSSDFGVRLSTFCPGDIFNDREGTQYILCGFVGNDEDAIVLKKEFLDSENVRFGSTNDWRDSDIRRNLNDDYLNHLEKMFGAENIVEHEADLLSLDGLDDYGRCMDKVSLMTVDDYRKYRKVIGGNMNAWWWLLTPDQTPTSGDTSFVRCVGVSGGLYFCGSQFAYCCVRPFFTLKSSIFVSR